MNEINYGKYDAIPPKVLNEPHMLVLLNCDISGSMAGTPISQVNRCINRFKNDICKDQKAAKLVDVAVMGFNDSPHLEQNWRPITDLEPVDMKAGGGTDLSTALVSGVEMLRERGHYYEDMGSEVKMPYMILITDGYGGDVTEAAELIKKRTADRKMKLWVLCVKGYDKETVATLTNGVRVFELVNEDSFDFTEFFDFMAVSIKAVSTSSVNKEIHVNSNIAREGSTCRVPDLDKWINK